MSFTNILVEREDATAIVSINRPKVLNALNADTMSELGQALKALKDDSAVRVVVVTGSGEKAFVAGADINELARLTAAAAREYARAGQAVFAAIEGLGKPTIAAVNGFALGGGCELAMACTIRIAAETAKFGQPEISLGTIPGFAGTQRLPRLIGRGRALEWLLTGSIYSAAEAFRVGLVNRVVPAADLMNEAKKLAHQLGGSAPLATRYILDAVDRGLQVPFEAAESYEATLFGLAASTKDMREGTAAFLEKRKPTFTGE